MTSPPRGHPPSLRPSSLLSPTTRPIKTDFVQRVAHFWWPQEKYDVIKREVGGVALDTRAEATLDPVHSYFQLKGSGSQPQARLGCDKSHLLTVSITRAMSDSRAQPGALSFGVPTGSTACQAQHVCAPGVRDSRTQAACHWFLQGEGWRVGGGGTLAPGSWRVGLSRPLPASPSLAPHSLCKKTDKGLTFSEPHSIPTCSRLSSPGSAVQIQGYCQAVGTVNLPHSFIHALASADSAEEKQTPPNPYGL